MRHYLALAAVVLVPLAARAEGDAAAGKTVFAQCAICHSVKPDENKIGPSLYGIVGRQAHSQAGFAYSEAMNNYTVTWDETELDKYLTDPRKVVNGTKMIYPGVKDETKRANLIAYLATLK